MHALQCGGFCSEFDEEPQCVFYRVHGSFHSLCMHLELKNFGTSQARNGTGFNIFVEGTGLTTEAELCDTL